MNSILKKAQEYFPLSWKGWIVFLLGMAGGSLICTLLQTVSTSDVHVPMIFVLMVLIISMLTDGRCKCIRCELGIYLSLYEA